MAPITELRHYQEEGVQFLFEHKRALCTDQPGMGKTVQSTEAAIRAIAQDMYDLKLDKPRKVLVVCPGYLVEQWKDFLEEQYPHMTVAYAQPRTPSGERFKVLYTLKADWIVINKEMLREYPVPSERFAVLILDESHHYRNHDAKQSKGALAVARDIPYVFELTATPIKKEADDLFMQLKILDPDKFTSYWQFVNTYLWTGTTNGYGTKVFGVRRPKALRDVIGLYGIGRTYKEVDLQLPRLLSKKILVTMGKEESLQYEMIRRYWRDQEKTYNNYMAALQALRQITACDAKFEAVQGIVEDADSPVVVFCWYHNTARKLGKILNCPVITGNVPQNDRPIIAKQGTHIVATIPSLSEGVDLSHSHNVIFVEEDYTPGSRIQALARVRRWSANNSEDPTRVLCYYVMAQGTVDLTVHNAVEGRVHTLDQILEQEYLKDEATPEEEAAALA